MTVLLYACFCVSIMKSLALFKGKGKRRILITYADRFQKNQVNGATSGQPRKNPPVFSETQGFFKKPKKFCKWASFTKIRSLRGGFSALCCCLKTNIELTNTLQHFII